MQRGASTTNHSPNAMQRGASTTNRRPNVLLLHAEARLTQHVAELRPTPRVGEPRPMLPAIVQQPIQLDARVLHDNVLQKQSAVVAEPNRPDDFGLKLLGDRQQQRDAVSTSLRFAAPMRIVATHGLTATTTATSVRCTGTTVCSSMDPTHITTTTTWSTTRPSQLKVKPAPRLWKWSQPPCPTARWTVTTRCLWDCALAAT